MMATLENVVYAYTLLDSDYKEINIILEFIEFIFNLNNFF